MFEKFNRIVKMKYDTVFLILHLYYTSNIMNEIVCSEHALVCEERGIVLLKSFYIKLEVKRNSHCFDLEC